MKRRETAIPAHRASLARSQEFFFFFNNSENTKEILFKVKLQTMKIQAGSGTDLAPVWESYPPGRPSLGTPQGYLPWVGRGQRASVIFYLELLQHLAA